MKPTIDEQIEWQKQLLRNHPQAEFKGNAILASLERLKRLDSQPVPVEPEIVGWLEHHKAGDNIGWEQVDHPYAKADALIKKSDYDALQSALRQRTEKEIHIVFDGPPSHESGRFVECETADGKSVNVGRWEQRGKYWHLIIGGEK